MKERCEIGNRVCTKCKQEKPITEFYFANKKYRMAECKTCYKERVHTYREQNLEKCKATDKAYYYSDPKKNNRWARAYQKKFHKKVAKQAIIRYFVKKLKEEFQVDLNIKIRGQTLDELTEIHHMLKSVYKLERKKC
jgi:hypothetical protein